jgi:hypothetical protein
MLISLIAWTYLSILCLIWGHLFLSVIRAIGNDNPPVHPALLCLTGLAAISTLALGLSIITPLDWKCHALLLLGAILHLVQKPKREGVQKSLVILFRDYTPLQFALLAACIAMVLVISIYPINHPDTLHYHARSILLLQRYTTIPGVANLQTELGFQSGWFAALAIVNPGNYYNFIFLNGAVLCWFFSYVISTWNKTWIGWLLLTYTLFSWVQVRLTAASPSPDFIVSLYAWAAIYCWLMNDDAGINPKLYPRLTVLFSLAAILTKASALLFLLLATLAYIQNKKKPVRLLIYSLIALLILFVKNAIASGYILYPSSFPDLLSFTWKMPLANLKAFQQYISQYATIPFTGPVQPLHLSWMERVKGWWSYIEAADRLLLLGISAGMIIHIILLIMKGKRSPLFIRNRYTIALAFTFIGSLVWLWAAPSPRFGTGFLVPLLYLLFYLLPQPASKPTKLLTLVASCCLFIIVSAYTVYRCVYFPVTTHLITPAGIDAAGYDPISYEGSSVDFLHDRVTTPDGLLTGQSIRQGFNAR